MKEIGLPLKGSVVGTITKVDEVSEALRMQLNSDARVVTVQDFKGADTPVWFSENQIAEFGLDEILFIGNVVSIAVEYRIKDETYYDNAIGERELHTATITAGTNASHASEATILLAGLPDSFCERLTTRREAVAGKVGERKAKPNIGKVAAPTTEEGIKALIADLERKAVEAPDAYKTQYTERIATLKAMLPKATAEKPVEENSRL